MTTLAPKTAETNPRKASGGPPIPQGTKGSPSKRINGAKGNFNATGLELVPTKKEEHIEEPHTHQLRFGEYLHSNNKESWYEGGCFLWKLFFISSFILAELVEKKTRIDPNSSSKAKSGDSGKKYEVFESGEDF